MILLLCVNPCGEGIQGKRPMGKSTRANPLWPLVLYIRGSGYILFEKRCSWVQAGGWGTRWHLDYPTTLTVLCSFGSCPSHIRLTSHLLGRWTGLSQLMLNWSPWNPKLFSTIITPSRQLVYDELPLPWTAPQSSRQLEAEARQGCWEARLPTVGPVEDGLREEQKKGQVGPRYLSIMFSLRQWTCY